jgi:hypothetical protein
MSELLREAAQSNMTASAAEGGINAADAVRLVVNTAVAMRDYEPAIDVRSMDDSARGPGVLIWIPGYVSNGKTIVAAGAAVGVEAAPPAPHDTYNAT